MAEELDRIWVSPRMTEAMKLVNTFLEKSLEKKGIKGIRFIGGKPIISKIAGEMLIRLLTNNKNLSMEITTESNGLNKYNISLKINNQESLELLTKIIEDLASKK